MSMFISAVITLETYFLLTVIIIHCIAIFLLFLFFIYRG